MQVNLNTNINQTKPSFGKLKAIGFATHAEKSALRGDSGLLARRKLLEICELPIIKKLFDKYDGGIYFSVSNEHIPSTSPIWPTYKRACCIVRLENIQTEMEKIKKSYIKKGFEQIGDYYNFGGVSHSKAELINIADIELDTKDNMHCVNELVKTVKSYDTENKLKEIEDKYNTLSSQSKAIFEESCKKILECRTPIRDCEDPNSIKEREEFAAKIQELLGD